MLPFKTTPSMENLGKLTSDQLSNIPSFTIDSEHAKIEWLSPVDLCEVDLSKAIEMKHKVVDVYPEASYPQGTKPAIGTKLNSKARITYKNMQCPSKMKAESFERKMRRWTVEKNIQFISWNR